jgi:cytoskeletal protein RodZ
VRRGRHAARANFSRDLVIMIVGIMVVGAVVFGGLWLGASLFGGDTSAADTTTDASDAVVVSTETTGVPTTSTTTPQTVTTTAPAETTVPTITPREPSEIVVQILNAVGTTGLAAQVTSEVRAAGYDTVPPDDYEPILTQSQILFRDGFGPEAFELAALFPDAQVGLSRDMPEGVDLIVLLGGSYEAG